jgi:tetratricopeptide (TPR) repeat protein/predicted Ser/Thr protein kinase
MDSEVLRVNFLALRELAERERAERLAELERGDVRMAGEVGALLRADEESSGFLEAPALGHALDLASLAEPDEVPPKNLGKYAIEGVLGRGGMGVVYRATQEAPHRTVALKVLDAPHQARRFEHEAELLARLSHPGIAQVFESGTVTVDGRPRAYLAMELVPGGDLRAAAARLAPEARLVLLQRIAEAVAHAHRKGIVHRDLKPENILVDERGAPKVVDFGVARWLGDPSELTTQHTEAGRLVGTPWYMSPEQLAGDPDLADTRSDVYALGVIGYELFAGSLPYALERRELAEVARVIRDQEPARLGAAARAFPDLEVVLAKCLAKEPERRYGSASELADELARVARSEPIHARPPSSVYLLRRFVRRNRAFSGALVAALLTLLGGSAAVFLQARRATRERDRALLAEDLAEERLAASEAERRKFESGFLFVNRLLASVDPTRDGKDARVADLLARAGSELAGTFPAEPELEADLRRALGGSWRALGQPEEALAELTRALELGRGQAAAAELALMHNDVALLLGELGRADEARPHFDAALELQAADPAARPVDRLVTRNNLANAERRAGNLVRSEELLRAVLVEAEALALDDEVARRRASARRGLSDQLQDRGELAEARLLLERNLAELAARFAPGDPDVLGTLNNLAALEAATGDLPGAIAHLERCHAGYSALLPAAHPSLLTIESNLGTLLVRAGRAAEGLPRLRAAHAGRRDVLGAENSATLTSANNLGSALVQTGALEEAEQLLGETRASQLRTLGAEHWMPHATGVTLAECLTRRGRAEEAEALLEECLPALVAKLGPKAEKSLTAARLLARLCAERGDEAAAEALRAEFGLDPE